MPHVIIEHSANITGTMDLDGLIARLHAAALETGVFPLGGLRTRAAERTRYRIADGHPDNGFVHVTLRMGHGRDPATKRAAAEHVFAALCDHLEPLFRTSPLGISLEVQEIDPDLSFKHNNLHDIVARRRQGAAETE
ncbi:MAG: 5-carboxymethyl-2-hydroxymuconate Delta-isomerase [Hyphomicrobiales bacterium]|nr:5-carboxymethyl-2-hydroxymuconate Delta-isomerase [Hyphomicrobiales bacterium]